MTTPQQFGDYVLFRKLSSDAVGTTYRAGKMGGQGIERVVLLRLFDGPGIDPASVWNSLANRGAIHGALQNPHIGDGIDVGREGEVPYAAYEYVSGKPLSDLLEQARLRPFPIPIEHAFFIAERITFGLSAAYGTRWNDSRVLHGFLVPDLIMLSNEGEVRVLGFEAATSLRDSLGDAGVREAYRSYLAPEVAPGAPVTPSDDVFSLGSLLFELLTGKPLPSVEGSYDPVVDEASLAADESTVPPQIKALLKASLSPRSERIANVSQWQQSFSRFISDADYNPTTFNLAFFMHTLFRGEIERETVEIEREKSTPVDLSASAPATEPATPRQTSAEVLVPPTEAADYAEPEEEATRKQTPPAGAHYARSGFSRKALVVGGVAALAIGAGLAAAFFFPRTGSSPQTAAALSPATPATSLATAPIQPAPAGATEAAPGMDEATPDIEEVAQPGDPDIPAGPPSVTANPAAEIIPPAERIVDESMMPEPPPVEREPEFITAAQMQARIRELVDARALEIEGNFQARYEDEIAALRTQLEEARQEGGKIAAATDGDGAPPPLEEVSPPNVATEAEEGDALGATGAPQTGAAVLNPQAPQGQVAEEPDPTPPPAQPEPPPPPNVGDLVGPGPGVVPPRIVRRPIPRYPPTARKLGKVATVVIQVLVDENGEIADTRQVGERVGYGFDDAAMSAARNTSWQAATKEGVQVKMWVDLRIEFRP